MLKVTAPVVVETDGHSTVVLLPSDGGETETTGWTSGLCTEMRYA